MKYSIANARAKFSEIVNEVQGGSEIEITRRGKRVAVVLSPARYARLRGEHVSFWAALENFREAHDLDELGLDGDWAQNVRDRSVGREVRL